MTETILCCGQPATKSQLKASGLFIVACPSCGKSATGKTADGAVKAFAAIVQTTALATIPTAAANLPAYMASHMSDMAHIAVPFLANDTPALTRLVKNNCRYVMLQDSAGFLKVWDTLEGQESIIHGLEEALALGASMPEMGYLVPFGSVVEFIPKVEAYEFALTNGKNPPFKWVQIDMIHEKDVVKLSRINGSFSIEVTIGKVRGPLLSVAVYGHNNRVGHVIGEVYDKARLLGKAEAHSTSYKYYLQDMEAFQMARIEGKLQIEGTREYLEKTMFKKGGGSWTKKLYEDEITNPYAGADQPEMLRKAAGKSFLGKYARIRNSEAAMDEVSNSSEKQAAKIVDATLNAAFENMDAPATGGIVIDKPSNGDPVYVQQVGRATRKPKVEPDPPPDDLDVSLKGREDSIRAESDEPDIDAEIAELDAEKGEQGELGI
jgi:hypothetical protein